MKGGGISWVGTCIGVEGGEDVRTRVSMREDLEAFLAEADPTGTTADVQPTNPMGKGLGMATRQLAGQRRASAPSLSLALPVLTPLATG